jgi:hypothetical protein
VNTERALNCWARENAFQHCFSPRAKSQ